MKKPLTIIAVLLALGGAAWLLIKQLSPPRPNPNEALARYERRSRAGKDRVIVFVHGIFGNANETWKCDRTGVSWPKLILSDDAFKDADVYVAAYRTPYFGNAMTIDEVVNSLSSRFVADQVFGHREVVFVCHSLGGLVVQRFLLTFRELASQVPFIYFFSTPETGSQLAKVGHLFSSDPLLKEMFSGNENDYLLNLENEWVAARFPIKRYCAYEKQRMRGVLVVDRLSGTRNCTAANPIPITADHATIVKPCSDQDESYIALRNAIVANPIAPPPKQYATVVEKRDWTSPSMNVDCEREVSGTTNAAIALDPQFSERVLSVTAAIIDADNIKEPSASVISKDPASLVEVTYSFKGLNKNPFCPGGGHARVSVTFTVERKVPVP
jgi:pimeloyl-ACP methyl ester carboxylesterase